MFLTFLLNTLLLSENIVNRLTSDDNLVRLLHGGKVRGAVLMSAEGRPFHAFRGIPYAEPPVGDLRFKEPVPKSGWRGHPFDATTDGPVCVHESLHSLRVGVEDCLTVNVYTPEVPKWTKPVRRRAVMVFFHGGSFMIGDGTSESLPPYNFMDYDIVLVTLNYRLEALGFLSTGDSFSPGNYGLLDQRLALLWVKDNIEAFGGDPGAVTIFGHSAGAACVSYHLVSPLSKGLFHRAIAMSGSSLNPWAYEPNPIHWAKFVGQQVGCPQNSSNELIDCLRRAPAELVNLGFRHYISLSSLPVPFRPTLDGYFLPENPRTIMNSPEKLNKVPVLMGITELERIMDVWVSYMSFKEEIMRDSFLAKKFNNSISSNDLEIIHMIKERYLTSADPNNGEAYAMAMAKALSHGLFDMNHYEEVKLLSEAGLPVYAYSYNYKAEALIQLFFSKDDIFSVTGHMEDLFLMFDVELIGKLKWTENDRVMLKILLKIWTNFAKTSNPDPSNELHPSWTPSSPHEIHIHNLDLEVTSKVYAVNEDELFHFWTKDVHLARMSKQKREE